MIDQAWLRDSDASLKSMLAIDHKDAGLGEIELMRYADLPARDAALQFGEDYELTRIEHWMGLTGRRQVCRECTRASLTCPVPTVPYESYREN